MTSETTDFSMTDVEHCPVSVPWSSVRSKNTVIQLAMVHCRRREQSSKCRCTLPHHHRRTGRQEASRHWQRGSSFHGLLMEWKLEDALVWLEKHSKHSETSRLFLLCGAADSSQTVTVQSSSIIFALSVPLAVRARTPCLDRRRSRENRIQVSRDRLVFIRRL